MKYIGWWCFVFLWANAVLGIGGDTGGNGGDIIICDEGNGKFSHRLLDYYEAEFGKTSLKLDLIKGSDPLEKAKAAIDRIRVVDPKHFESLSQAADKFLSQVEWIKEGPPLEAIPDLGEVQIPAHCKIAQIAIRRKTFHPTVKPFLIDERLWTLLTSDHRAGLILHEIIYGEMIALGHKNSVTARGYNGYLASSVFDHVGQSEYDEIARRFYQEVKPLAFKAEAFTLRVRPGDSFELSLRALLAHQSVAVSQWYVLQKLPTWLTLDAKSELLSGVTPTDFAPFNASLVAHDGNAGAICELRFELE